MNFRFAYVSSLMFAMLLYRNYADAIKEGDGEREGLCIKFMMMYFRKTGAKKLVTVHIFRLILCSSAVRLYCSESVTLGHWFHHPHNLTLKVLRWQNCPFHISMNEISENDCNFTVYFSLALVYWYTIVHKGQGYSALSLAFNFCV